MLAEGRQKPMTEYEVEASDMREKTAPEGALLRFQPLLTLQGANGSASSPGEATRHARIAD
jgi:hypothetical protein